MIEITGVKVVEMFSKSDFDFVKITVQLRCGLFGLFKKEVVTLVYRDNTRFAPENWTEMPSGLRFGGKTSGMIDEAITHHKASLVLSSMVNAGQGG